LPQAETAIVEAIAVAHRIHDELGEARATSWQALVARSSGDFGRAVTLLETSLSTFRGLGHGFGVWWAMNQLGETLMRVGEYERARLLLEECVEMARTIGSVWGIADTRHRLGMVIFRQGDIERATALLEESLAGYTALRAHGLHTCLLDLGTIALARGDVGGAAEYFAHSLTRCHEIGDRYNTARSLEGLAETVAALGASSDADTRSLAAAHMLGAATMLREQIGFTVAPMERPVLEQAEAAIRAAIGNAAYDASWSAGRALSLDDAVERALGLAAWIDGAPSKPTSSAVRSTSSAATSESPLTRREREVAALIARGLRNRQIATELVLSERTVHVHVASILSKLGFRSRSQIAVWAVEHGLGPQSES
jgi:non-specific serine/threonine protein kinase